ncbi:hypothetical protein [Ancylobacter lacus]|uniref:hypothetical protein n=1 Tax=Ancylobacter lacus TaxID=2579970 RepID=UPI001BCFAD0E|nr:hypothetical protein [Ancylobacter lacus]MBS7537786.1 hypothetical protein [Ancylobacter lacus]
MAHGLTLPDPALCPDAPVDARLSPHSVSDPARLLEGGTRFLLARPRAGLNDALMQLERCRRYAAAYDRTLVLDLTRGGMRLPFGELFRARPEFGCAVLDASPDVIAALDRIADVEPAGIAGRLGSYEPTWHEQGLMYACRDTGTPLRFDMSRDHAARCLVYEQAGGGLTGVWPLRGLSLAPDIAAEIVARLARLGPDYDALHVRHTDYQTDFRKLFERTKPLFVGRRLLVCTDSAEVQRFARSYFAPEVEVLFSSEIPDLGGKPIHETRIVAARVAAVDQFCDLIAMARARRYLFSALSSLGQSGRPMISGYSILVEGMRTLPQVAEGLLALAPNREMLARAAPPAAAPRLSLGQRLARAGAEMGSLVWNRRVQRKRLQVRRAVLGREPQLR